MGFRVRVRVRGALIMYESSDMIGWKSDLGRGRGRGQRGWGLGVA